MISVYDDNEAKIVESLLRAYNIPFLRKYTLLGLYFQLYWGLSVIGVELSVPAKALTIAQAILENKDEEPESVITEIEEAELDRLQESYQKMRKIWGWIIIFCYLGVVGVLAIVGYSLYLLIDYRKKVFYMNS